MLKRPPSMTGNLLVSLVAAIAIGLPHYTSSLQAATSNVSLITEPTAGTAPIERMLSGARYSIDLVIYELIDPRIESLLVAASERGVRVRVLLDRDDEESRNAAAFAYLGAHDVNVRWASAPRIELTHEKAAVIDGTTALVMTLNLVTKDYPTTRDFAVVDRDANDVAAIEKTFNADWSGTTITPPRGADLVWSPGAESALVGVIDGARATLLVENEEMADPYITVPLEAAARRGVRVEVVMTASSSWTAAFDALRSAGVHVRTYATSAPLYIHAKAIVADAGRSNGRVFVGSQNFSITSLVHNRELGIIATASKLVDQVASTINGDYAGARPWTG